MINENEAIFNQYDDEKLMDDEDAVYIIPKKKDLFKAINNELRKAEFSRLKFKARKYSESVDYYGITPIHEIKKHVYIFKVNGVMKKLDINELEFVFKK